MEDFELEYVETKPSFIRRYAVDFLSSAMSALVIISFILLGV